MKPYKAPPKTASTTLADIATRKKNRGKGSGGKKGGSVGKKSC